MELTYDWRSFQSMFQPRRKPTLKPQNLAGPVCVVVDKGVILASYCEGDDVSSWLGRTYQEMATEFPQREIVLFEREQVDQWVGGALPLPHLYDQAEFLRTKVAAQVVGVSKTRAQGKKVTPKQARTRENIRFLAKRHFLLDAIQGWWAKILPSAYGLLIRLEGTQERDLFILVRRGRIDSFHEPDLTTMGPQRMRQPGEVVKYLSERHLVPVQGVFVPEGDWNDWAESAQPWRKVAQSVRSNRTKLIPFRWGLASLMATRAFFKV